MKVKIEYTLEVDQADWAYFYDISPNKVREDVKSYFTNWMNTEAASEGLVGPMVSIKPVELTEKTLFQVSKSMFSVAVHSGTVPALAHTMSILRDFSAIRSKDSLTDCSDVTSHSIETASSDSVSTQA